MIPVVVIFISFIFIFNGLRRPARRTICTRCWLRTCWYCLLASSIQQSQTSSPSSHQERERCGRCQCLGRQITFLSSIRTTTTTTTTALHQSTWITACGETRIIQEPRLNQSAQHPLIHLPSSATRAWPVREIAPSQEYGNLWA